MPKITARSAKNADLAFVRLDFASAFTRLRRHAIVKELGSKCHEFVPLFKAWYGRKSKIVAMGAGGVNATFEQLESLDQGCPLSVAFFDRHCE